MRDKLDKGVISRRAALVSLAAGTFAGVSALEFLNASGHLERMLLPSLRGTGLQHGGATPFGTHELLSDALRGGLSSVLKLNTAFAQQAGQQDWSVVTIKVVNHVSTSLVFRLGALQPDNTVVTEGDISNASFNISEARKSRFIEKGVDRLTDNARLRALRFNKWFADMLFSGKSESSGTTIGIDTTTMGGAQFPDDVALQIGLSLMQEDAAVNHSLNNFCVRNAAEGDLAHYLSKKGLVESPLGITAFMMGGLYDNASQGQNSNYVLSVANGNSQGLVAKGQTVKSYQSTFEQTLGSSGFSDTAAKDNNLTYAFDKLVKEQPKLREAMFESSASIKSALTTLGGIADSEVTRHSAAFADEWGGRQATGNAQDGESATQEFLVQCRYTAELLKLPGKPVRNFSLFLNTSDLDGQGTDATTAGDQAGAKPYTYLEGMRQLALGMNILAQVVKSQRNVIVVVVAEGGRTRNMADSKVSFGLIMGPKGPGLLADALFGPLANINKKNGPIVGDPGAASNGDAMNAPGAWDSPGLVTELGAAAQPGIITTSGDWQLGVAEFIADRKGITGSMAGIGKYVTLKRG